MDDEAGKGERDGQERLVHRPREQEGGRDSHPEDGLDCAADSLIALIELFAERTGRSVSTASRLVAGSGDVVARLRRGATITTKRLDRALRYLSEYWPEGEPPPPMPGWLGGGTAEPRGVGARKNGPPSVRDLESFVTGALFATLERRMAGHFMVSDQRFGAISEHLQAITAHLVAHDKRCDVVTKRLEALERRLDRLESVAAEVRVDIVQMRSVLRAPAPRGRPPAR